MRIGIIYTKIFPLSSSASVHGYYLFAGLKELGHEIHSFGIGANPITIDHGKSVKGLLSFIRNIDVLYIRINPWLWNDWFSLIKILTFGRVKVFWEINAPVEEVLVAYKKQVPGKIKSWIRKQNFKRKTLSHLCDGVVSVSSKLFEYIQEKGYSKNQIYLSNASDPELFRKRADSKENPLHEICKGKFVVTWAGNNALSWQGTNLIIEVAERMQIENPDVVFVTFGSRSLYNDKILPNLYSFNEVRHDILPEFLSYAHVGLCLYNDYDWCPYGFYGSPLKLFDYMSMELVVISSGMGQINEIVQEKKNGFLTNNAVDEIIDLIKYSKDNFENLYSLRKQARQDILDQYNWKLVASQTAEFLKKKIKNS